MDIRSLFAQQIKKVQKLLDRNELALGEITFNNNDCQVLSQSAVKFELIVDFQHGDGQAEFTINLIEDDLIPIKNGERKGWE
jgi:hypothetical protein